MSQLSDFCRSLSVSAAAHNIRYLVVAKGGTDWAAQVIDAFAPFYVNPLFCGEPISADTDAIPFKKAKHWLGRECQMLTVNGHNGLDAQALGALSGTVVGGGILLLLLPTEWFEKSGSNFTQRLSLLLQQPEVMMLEPGLPLPALPIDELAKADSGVETASLLPFGTLTACQASAVDAIRRVVTGHRKRPLVLTADRGRGKSASLGLAAASLLAERNIHIVVTAPSFVASQTVFRHAAEQFGVPFSNQKFLELGKGSIAFIAPDALLSEKPAADLVMVDEAAAIPAPVLNALLKNYGRLVFSSTVHGYEGTGRGFAVKFRQQLDDVMPQWRAFEMKQAIRWADNDPLEKWVFNALLLDAETAASGLDPSTAHCECIDKAELLRSNNLLSSLFGLLINAHYQTSPADLVNLLDDDCLHIWVYRNGDNVLACCLIVDEGGFSPELAEQIQLGVRRPRGHLLAQSLAAHLGISEAATQRSGRILRIAVHPEFQQQGIGQRLLSAVRFWSQGRYDFLGTSFGYVTELLYFWQRAGYQPVRLGLHKDASSGYPSLLCVQPIGELSQQWFAKARVLFARGLTANACEAFRDMATDEFRPLLVESLSSEVTPAALPNEWVEHQLSLYCQGGLGYELVLPALQQYLYQRLAQTGSLSEGVTLNLAVAKVIQRKTWQDIVHQFQLTGRKQAEQALRDFVSADFQTHSIARSE
ncbi:tRNA(Met) cytidine acetyltransferase TmcA [Photobacterium lutimaris]|uniref:tRNA(Met) cytidine acetyltransferase TmcA n=1 Tax=Photobacterium lutimaris TaxID=388278 RepID=A0A2T3IYE0_9GAMM|nr:GNAT family N-acetyltransferase [Photobacterium lutimaris]PSU33589.1 P-loop ATPase [Photobacterium lutimaris]TDR74566.1 tRNA(Met)-cytidine N(4)-acetyltransferase [Photobacterium lutimaris]